MNLDFDNQERNAVLLLAFAFSILLIFWHLFGEEITWQIIVGHLILFFGAMLVAVFLHEAGHKLWAHRNGYTARITKTGKGLVASIAIAFYTFGNVPIITPNRLSLDADPRKRMSKKLKYDNPAEQARIAIAGILGSVVAITLFRALFELTGWSPFATLQFGAVLHAIYSMVPFELLSILSLKFKGSLSSTTPSDGMHILRSSHLLWIFVFAFILFFAVIANIPGTTGFVLSLLLAGATTAGYGYFAS